MEVIGFLRKNGWEENSDAAEDYRSFFKKDNIGIDVADDEIVFVGEEGDFCHIPNNIFALLGALLHFRALAIDYYWHKGA